MKVISLICQKGGHIQDNTAINLAVEAISRGLEVVLIDLDPQVSACNWKDIRDDKPPVVAATLAKAALTCVPEPSPNRR